MYGTVCALWVLVLHGNYYFSHINLNNPTLFKKEFSHLLREMCSMQYIKA